MRVRVLHAKLYAYALPGLTARQLFNSSTLLDNSTARQMNSTELDRARQSSTPRHMQSVSTCLDGDRTRQSSTELDRARHPGTCSQSRLASTGSTATRQLLDRQGLDSTSTAARRSLDSSTAQQPGLKPEPPHAMAVRRVVEAVVCVGTSTHHRTRDSLCGQRLVLTWLDMTRLPPVFLNRYRYRYSTVTGTYGECGPRPDGRGPLPWVGGSGWL